MENTSQFQGISGQVIRKFISFNSFLVFIPVLIYWALFFVLVYFVAPKVSPYIFFSLHLLAASLLLARFAIPAKDGDFESGFLNPDISWQDSFAYALRYIVYTLYWLVPLALIAKFTINDSMMMSIFSIASGSGVSRVGFLGLLLIVLLLVQLFAPVVCAILANITESYAELVSPEPFRYLFQNRLAELSSYFSAIIGGLLVFYAKYLIPFFIIDFIAFKISFEAGMTATTITYFLPYYISPVLIGRLSGAFILGEEELGNSSPEMATDELQNNKYKQLYLNTMIKLPYISVDKAKKMLQTISKENQDNLYIQLLLSHLYLKANDKNNGLKNANIALKTCLKEGASKETSALFQSLAQYKSEIQLDKDDYVLLASFLLDERLYMESAWCYLMAMNCTGIDADETLSIQKKYLSVADEAQKTGGGSMAYTLYDLFVRNFPKSSLSSFAKEQRDMLAGRA